LEVLFIGADGKLNVLWKEQNGPWKGPVGISNANIAPPGGGVSLAYYPLNQQLEATFVANNGAVHVIWKTQNGPWNPPVSLTGASVAPPGAATSTTYYPINHQLESFFVDREGAVSLVWKANNGRWSAPVRLSPVGAGVPGRQIASVYQPLNRQLEVLTAGADGALVHLWKANNGAWAAPVALSKPGVATPGSKLSVAFQPLNNQLEAFYSDGELGFVWKAQNQSWVAARRFPAGAPQKPGVSDTTRESGGIAPADRSDAIAADQSAFAMAPRRCKSGFVWREAKPDDYICVPPASRTRTAQENAQAASRRDPNGAYGPNTCVAGYVWREAFDGDVVCVTPEVRATVREENRLSS
ncbi:MAG: hypothetical protein KDA41_18810, partial [Planctomycetales bacterium]|nr:hypothetical protein [Planctomycetales bacterium]